MVNDTQEGVVDPGRDGEGGREGKKRGSVGGKVACGAERAWRSGFACLHSLNVNILLKVISCYKAL